MISNIYPCKDCAERHYLCWYDCVLYRKAKVDDETAKRKRKDSILNMSAEFIHNNNPKYWKRKGQF